MDNETLRNKLNDAFDVPGATVVKTQCCPVGRWVSTLLFTLFFGAVYGVCLWGLRLFYGSLLVFLIVVLTLALAFLLVRLWIAFFADVRGARLAERTVFLRDGDDRYYYTVGKYVRKFEYADGCVAVTGKSYDKFEDKSDFSPLAGRYDRALQRRSSAYSTLTPAFWFDVLGQMQCVETERGIHGEGRRACADLTFDENGKIARIVYRGDEDRLFDSVSPLKLFNGKIFGKYEYTYTFTVGEQPAVVLPSLFCDAVRDYLWRMPPERICRFDGAAGESEV